jgi:putative transposase
MDGMLPTRMRRLPQFEYVGAHRYSLTLCAFERKSLFTNAGLVEVMLAQILRAAALCEFQILAYCFMPDHVHLIVRGAAESASLIAFMKRAKQLAGFHGRRVTGGPVWQPGYCDRVLRESEDTRIVVAYVLANPVRAGLVNAPGDYPFSGSGICTLEELLEYVSGTRHGSRGRSY